MKPPSCTCPDNLCRHVAGCRRHHATPGFPAQRSAPRNLPVEPEPNRCRSCDELIHATHQPDCTIGTYATPVTQDQTNGADQHELAEDRRSA